MGLQESQVETAPLWHGTDEDTVTKIASGKFDRGLSGKNGKISIFNFNEHNFTDICTFISYEG